MMGWWYRWRQHRLDRAVLQAINELVDEGRLEWVETPDGPKIREVKS